MPNQKVKYLKEQNDIKDKIIYLKDKDVLGFDSASSIIFEFNFQRLKYFGISNNCLYFNDDYFVGRLKKDFFYQLNGKLIPHKYGKFSQRKIKKKTIRYNKVISHRKKYK